MAAPATPLDMDVIVAPRAGEVGKFEGMKLGFPGIWNGRVLDVGSRTGNLRSVLDPGAEYVSLDLYPPADIIGTLDERLPIDDGAFDLVVALDVLEHTNVFHHAFQELLRVSSRHVLISLPNMYELRVRARVATGRAVSRKYGLPLDTPADRHRWFFSLDDARAFCTEWSARLGWRVRRHGILVGPRLARLGPLLSRYPNLLGPTYVALLERAAPA
jgi:SAM-dependent methyltransferase